MLKTYVERNETFAVQSMAVEVSESHTEVNESDESERDSLEVNYPIKLTNSEALLNLDTNLSHPTVTQQQDLKEVIHKFEHLFSDIPSKTTLMHHDVDVDDSPPIRQHPYRLKPIKERYFEKEIGYLLENDCIEPSSSNWSSPCILVPKPDGSYRMCTDYRLSLIHI